MRTVITLDRFCRCDNSTCLYRVAPIVGASGLLGRAWCDNLQPVCPYRESGDVVVVASVADLPVVAAGVAHIRQRYQRQAYMTAAGQYDVLPYLLPSEMDIARKFAAEFQRLGVPWALVLGGEVFSLYKRLPAAKPKELSKDDSFRPVVERGGVAAYPRLSRRYGVCE